MRTLDDKHIRKKGRQDASSSEIKEKTLWWNGQYQIIATSQFQNKAGRRWTWRSPDGNTND